MKSRHILLALSLALISLGVVYTSVDDMSFESYVSSSETEAPLSKKQSKQSVNESDLIGHWQGSVPFATSKFSLSFETRKDAGGSLTASYNFFGARKGVASPNEDEKTLGHDNGQVKFFPA